MKIGTKYSEGKEAVKAAWDSYLVSNHGDNTTITEKSTARFLYMVCKCGEKDCAQLRASVKEGIWTINKVQPRKAMCCSKRERNVASKVIRQSNPVIFNKVLAQKQSGKGAKKEAESFMDSAANLGGTNIRLKACQKLINEMLGDNICDHVEGVSKLVGMFEELKRLDPKGVYIVELNQVCL